MEKIRISAVRYANTYPFIWGLRESGFEDKAIIETDHPSECAAKVISRRADLGLIPVAALPDVKKYEIAADYCIGANGNVRTVMIFSNSPFENVRCVNLDYRSRSSVNLTRVLARHMWQREFEWKDTSASFDFINIPENEAVVLIGDQCFVSEPEFSYKMDLAGEWNKHTGLPFVFALWASNIKLDDDFRKSFNASLKYGVDNIHKVAESFAGISVIGENELENYLRNNIDYNLNQEKMEGLKLFLKLLAEL